MLRSKRLRLLAHLTAHFTAFGIGLFSAISNIPLRICAGAHFWVFSAWKQKLDRELENFDDRSCICNRSPSRTKDYFNFIAFSGSYEGVAFRYG
jgi:hypothetical protein